MCGNFINPTNKGFLGGPVGQTIASLAAAPILGPAIGGITGAGLGLSADALGATIAGAGVGGLTHANGGIGSALTGAALGGVGGFASGGGFGEIFPETTAAIHSGVDSVFNGIGDGVSSVGNALGFGSSATTPGAAVSSVSAPSGLPTSSPAISGVSGGASAAAPSSASSATDWFDNFNANGGASSLSEPLSSNIGSGTVGSSSVPASEVGRLFDGVGTPSQLSTAGAGSPGIFDKIKTGVVDSLTKNPLGIGISALGLGADAMKGNQPMTGESELKAAAANLGTQGQDLGSYLQSGTLPAGLQQSLNQATNSAKATIRSKYASMGMSGSSSEQQELQAIDQRAQAQGAEIGLQLLQTGINETGMASGLYEKLMNVSIQEDQSLGSAISNFASSFGGGSPSGGGVTVNYGGSHG